MWVSLGRPSPFALIEYGAGSGTLGLAILDGLRRHGSDDLLGSIRYEPVESNPYRLADLQQRFEQDGLADRWPPRARTALPAGRPRRSPCPSPASSLPMSSSTPCRSTASSSAAESCSSCSSSGVTERTDPRAGSRKSWPSHRPRSWPRAWRTTATSLANSPRARSRRSASASDRGWTRFAARLASGFVLVIDYGYEAAELYGPRRLAGSLLGYRGHRVAEDPFADVGLTDLTAHVDFTALGLLAERRGFVFAGLATQQEFLVAAGLELELQALQASPELTLADYMRARSGILRMLDPRHMGRFRVLTLERD